MIHMHNAEKNGSHFITCRDYARRIWYIESLSMMLMMCEEGT